MTWARSVLGDQALQDYENEAQGYRTQGAIMQAIPDAQAEYEQELERRSQQALQAIAQAQIDLHEQYADDAMRYEAQGMQAPGTTQAINAVQQQYGSVTNPAEEPTMSAPPPEVMGPPNVQDLPFGQQVQEYLTRPIRQSEPLTALGEAKDKIVEAVRHPSPGTIGGAAVGALAALPESFGRGLQQTAEEAGVPEPVARVQGQVASLAAPFGTENLLASPGRAIATGVGAGLGALGGGGIGVLQGEAPEDVAGRALTGAAAGGIAGGGLAYPAVQAARKIPAFLEEMGRQLPQLSGVMAGLAPPGAATTAGQRATDIGLGAAGAIAAQPGEGEDQSLPARLGRGAVGFALGARAGPAVRELGTIAGAAGRAGEVFGARAGTKPLKVPRETVGEAVDATIQMVKEGRVDPMATASPALRKIDEAVNSVFAKGYKHIFAVEKPLERTQKLVYDALGRAPTDAEDAVAHMRIFAGRMPAVAQRVETTLQPALKGLTKQEEEGLAALLINMDNADVAAATATRVQQAALAKSTRGGLVGQAKAMGAPRNLKLNQSAVQSAAAEGIRAAQQRLFSGPEGSPGIHAHPPTAVEQEVLSRFPPESQQKIRDAAQAVWAFTRDSRDRLFRGGLMDQQTYAEWSQQFPHYVKTDILRHLPEEGGLPTAISGRPVLSIKSMGVRPLTVEGTASARENPINSIIKQAIGVENQVRRNAGANALLKMIEKDPTGGLQEAFTEVMPTVRAYRLAQKAGKNVLPPGTTADATQATFAAVKNGVPRVFLTDKRFEPLFNLDPQQMSAGAEAVVNAASILSGAPLLRQTATSLNLLFIPVNMVKDALQFSVRQDLRKLPYSAPALGRAYADLFSKGEPADLGRVLEMGGGQANAYFRMSPEQIRRQLLGEGAFHGAVRPYKNPIEFAGAVGDVAQLLFKPITAVGERVELAPRLAAYRLARAAGKSELQSTLAFRDVTVDFARGGDWVKFANRFIPFLNVGFQGMERFWTYDLRKGNRTSAAIGITAGVLASAAAEAWNNYYDPTGYADVPQHLKDTGIVVMTPIQQTDPKTGQVKHVPLWMPVPNEFQLLKGMVNAVAERTIRDDPRSAEQVWESLLRSVSPVGTDIVPLPPAAEALYGAKTNYDLFSGRPIVPTSEENLPPPEQAGPGTSGVARAAGQATDTSPRKIDYVLRTALGGVGQSIQQGSDVVARGLGLPGAERRDTGTITETPIVGGMARRFLRTGTGGEVLQRKLEDIGQEQARITRQQIDKLHASPSYRRLKPEDQHTRERRLADAVARSFDSRKRAAIELSKAGKLEQVERIKVRAPAG